MDTEVPKYIFLREIEWAPTQEIEEKKNLARQNNTRQEGNIHPTKIVNYGLRSINPPSRRQPDSPPPTLKEAHHWPHSTPSPSHRRQVLGPTPLSPKLPIVPAAHMPSAALAPHHPSSSQLPTAQCHPCCPPPKQRLRSPPPQRRPSPQLSPPLSLPQHHLRPSMETAVAPSHHKQARGLQPSHPNPPLHLGMSALFSPPFIPFHSVLGLGHN